MNPFDDVDWCPDCGEHLADCQCDYDDDYDDCCPECGDCYCFCECDLYDDLDYEDEYDDEEDF